MSTDDPITVHRHFDHARIVLAGDFDIDESEALTELARSLFTELTATVEVDMADVTFFGSRAIGALVHLSNEVARHSGAEMRITRSNERVMRILELTGLIDTLWVDPAGVQPMSDVA